MVFNSCGPTPLGLYPIVDSSEWLLKLLPLGVATIQLRIKDTRQNIAAEIKRSVGVAKHYQARLFINDYWQYALEYGAYGVHLGQEDLLTADLAAMQTAGLRLGISTHSDLEMACALRIQPSYIAFGPIFPTTSKVMVFGPQGIAQLQQWCDQLTYPVVAIGGINLARLPDILSTGVNGVAMISAITQAHDPVAATQTFLAAIEAHYDRINCQ